MPDNTLSLVPVYAPGGALCGEPPEFYRVTARGGAITIDCATLEQATLWLARWAEDDEAGR